MEIKKPLVGISTCLLGECVRYDGGHKLDKYLRDLLGKYVDYFPVCPEHECGLTIPREAMRLVQEGDEIKLMTQKSKQDITPQMKKWMDSKFQELDKIKFSGFMFKSKSPSSGLFRVKIYKNDMPLNKGRGIFAEGFTKRYPLVPVEEEGRLNDPKLRENFIERIFIMHEWYSICEREKKISTLMEFHATHKYTLMSHCPLSVKELGNYISNNDSDEKTDIDTIYQNYFEKFIETLSSVASVKKHTNVLEHMMGYFKKDLDAAEKKELKDVIENYHNRLVPLIVPITLIKHYAQKYESEYLLKQNYLNAHPLELMLRNHV